MNEARGNRLLLTLLIVVNILDTVDRQIMSALLEPIRREFHLSDSQLGILSGIAYGGAAILAAVPAATLADKFSRKTVLMAAFSLWSTFTALCGAATGYLALLLARMGVGATGGVGLPCSLSMIADSYPERRRASAVGTFYGASALSGLLAFSLGTRVAAHFGWRVAFFLAGAPALIVVPILLLYLVEPARHATAATLRKAPVREAFAAIVKTPQLALVIVAATIAGMPGGALYAWLTSFLIRNRGFELSRAGSVVAVITGFVIPLGMFTSGRLADRLASHRPGASMLLASVSCLGAAALGNIIAFSSVTGITIAALCCHGFIVAFYVAPAFAMVMKLAPAGARTTILAIISVLGTLAGGGGPYLMGIISQMFGGARSLAPAIAVVSLVSLLPAIIFAVLRHRLLSPVIVDVPVPTRP
jgi:predicted MFS family arabinose efflux permease